MIDLESGSQKSGTTWKKRLVVFGNRGAAERAFTRSQFASVVTRFQPRRYTAQESSEVQSLEKEFFHRYHLRG
jgi:hypothetical protein